MKSLVVGCREYLHKNIIKWYPSLGFPTTLLLVISTMFSCSYNLWNMFVFRGSWRTSTLEHLLQLGRYGAYQGIRLFGTYMILLKRVSPSGKTYWCCFLWLWVIARLCFFCYNFAFERTYLCVDFSNVIKKQTQDEWNTLIPVAVEIVWFNIFLLHFLVGILRFNIQKENNLWPSPVGFDNVCLVAEIDVLLILANPSLNSRLGMFVECCDMDAIHYPHHSLWKWLIILDQSQIHKSQWIATYLE